MAMVHGRRRTDLDTDRQFALALTRLVEVIGEAANRVPHAVREKHPSIPWRSIIATRHRLIHGYDEVDMDILWSIVRQDLPSLVTPLKQALESP